MVLLPRTEHFTLGGLHALQTEYTKMTWTTHNAYTQFDQWGPGLVGLHAQYGTKSCTAV